MIYRYEIQQSLSLADVFEELEKHKQEWEDYSLRQTTLEQIFLQMSKSEKDEVIVDVQ